VKYIIENTIQTPNENTKILDPACGSGSFLIVAYEYMLDYYYKKKNENKTEKEPLTVKERKKVLTRHIFGVDLDEQAVEVAKLSLLLKVLEVPKEVFDKRPMDEHALPSLHNNIKCGNSLIDDRSVDKKAFVWEEEFGDIMKKGGFDVVVGNPPYLNTKRGFANAPSVKAFFKNNYLTATGQFDSYSLFIEKALKINNEKGR